MRRLMMTALITLSALAATATTAFADTAEYVDAMKAFEPVVTAWHADFLETAELVSLKPEMACDAQVAELGRRGRSIARDLEGTNQIAPRSLSDIHGSIQGATDWMASVAEQACDGDYGLLLDTEPEREVAGSALMHLRTWLAHNQPVQHTLPIPGADNS